MSDEQMMEEVVDPMPQRWTALNNLTKREPITKFKGEYFDPSVDYGQVKILVVGAGGLGCEILKDLALSGFKDIEVIDMDTIDLSNLNRQFLFRQNNIGQPKAECAAKFVMNRVPGVQIVHHYGKIEDKPDEFYQQFNIVILGLDSLKARLWMTNKLCELLQWEISEDGKECVVDEASIIPVIDGGTEGFKGHARVIKPTVTATFEESMWMFPPQVAFPMCTIESTPRLPEHCVAYAKEVLWARERPFGEKPLDGDDFQHITWITEKAKARADEHNIKGVDYRFAQGVVKNIIPAIAATNALVSAACVSETLKMASGCGINLDNYFMYNGASIDRGLHSESFSLEPSAAEGLATPPHLIKLPADCTVAQLVERMKGFSNRNGETIEDTSKLQMSSPQRALVQTGVLAARTAANMDKPVFDLVSTEEPIELVTVTNPGFTTVRLMLVKN